MTVADPTIVDTVAQTPEGRYVLVMTEDRFYADGDVEAMTEQLVRKVNAYVRLIRSEQLPELTGADVRTRGVDIVLSCRDQPPEPVRRFVEVARERLRDDDGVDLRIELLPPPTPERVYDAVVPLLMQGAPAGWQRIELVATLIGNGLTGSLTAFDDSGAATPMAQPQWLPQAVRELKRALWEPERGTFTTFRAEIDHRQTQPRFEFGEPADGAAAFRPGDWAEELRRYPRAEVPPWWRAQLS